MRKYFAPINCHTWLFIVFLLKIIYRHLAHIVHILCGGICYNIFLPKLLSEIVALSVFKSFSLPVLTCDL